MVYDVASDAKLHQELDKVWMAVVACVSVSFYHLYVENWYLKRYSKWVEKSAVW